MSLPKKHETDWVERAHCFAVRVIRLSAHLPRTNAGVTVARQIVRSAPSIAVNLEEAKGALTLADTLHKTGISRREARETRRWLMIIRDVPLLPMSEELKALLSESDELVAMLTSGTKKLQARIQSGE